MKILKVSVCYFEIWIGGVGTTRGVEEGILTSVTFPDPFYLNTPYLDWEHLIL